MTSDLGIRPSLQIFRPSAAPTLSSATPLQELNFPTHIRIYFRRSDKIFKVIRAGVDITVDVIITIDEMRW